MIVQRPKEYISNKAIFPALVAPKLDGVRAKLTPRGLVSRRGNLIKGMTHILNTLPTGFNFSFDGELIVKGKNFDVASGLIRNYQEAPDTVYNVFDITNIGLSKIKRYYKLREVLGNIQSPSISVVEHHIVTNEAELLKKYKQFLDRGYEGLVYYNIDSKYENKKNYKWMKLFPEESADCKVIGFLPGTGKHEGSLGALIVEYKNKTCKVGVGFNEKPWSSLTIKEREKLDENTYNSYNRTYIWKNKQEFQGVYCECIFKEETKQGKMRQPRFKGWRWDK